VDTKILQTSPLDVQGVPVEIAFDVHPEQYPHGVELLLMLPGKLQPFGKIEVKRGVILMALPPMIAANLRALHAKEMADHAKKQAANGG
jgi:hypothetical protein